MKQPLIILTGPTAVGKTALSIELAKALNGEIISADSMQVYRHMDIGSAKIMPEEMEGVPHHLIDVLEPWEEFNVTRFQSMAKEAMAGIYSRGHVPIVTGGTGFYIQALAYDIDFTENEDHSGIREKLEQLSAEKGEEHLHQMLAEIDPESAEAIHANNVKRVIRAIEYFWNGQGLHGSRIVRNGIQFEEIFGYKTIKLNFVFLSSGITMPFCGLWGCFVIDKTRKVKFLYNIIRFPL